MSERDESPTQAKVSFGSVATYVFDTTSSGSVSSNCISRKSSVEDFERLRCQPRPHRKSEKRKGFDRSRFQQGLSQEIETAVDAGESGCPTQPQTYRRSEVGQLFTTSFPGADKPLLRRLKTHSQSTNGISQLHLSQLDLKTSNYHQATSGDNASGINSETMENAVFTFLRVPPIATPGTDTAPKRPARKRSTDKMTETCGTKDSRDATDLSLHNATWKMMAQTSNKRSRDCQDSIDCPGKDSIAAPGVLLQNATRERSVRSTKSNSKEIVLWKSFINHELPHKSFGGSTRRGTWQPPSCPIRKESKERLSKESLTAPSSHGFLAKGHMGNATWS